VTELSPSLKDVGDVSKSMSSNGATSAAPQVQESGIKAALKYTGIPQSWLSKRPKLPSRNWLIFIGVTSTITGYYLYDRRQCKAIRQAYVDKVKGLAEVPLHSHDFPRKVTVYGAKWPDDEDSDRAIKYFRKYVKVRIYPHLFRNAVLIRPCLANTCCGRSGL
jgi:import inner membrane translocase subunit TIM54